MNSVHCGWHCVRRIINDRNAQRLGQLIDSPHVARASAEVDRHNGSGSRCYRRGNFVGVYTERLAINVDEHDFGAEMANNFRRRCERKGWNNDFVAWPDAQGFENKVHSARVGCHRDGTNISPDKFCKFPFKRRHLRSRREPAAAEDGSHRIDVFFIKLEPEKRNF